ncbi:hypothetical protein K9N68_02320 [Kovacikia minuta CCNUW1]|uniref:hypothetical protein n=1 Tax=Kovacikia minuta TaxID=2931930 RepID=UPI001CC9266B|nr:hypothetical protein [Kovacikia minuta]UBF26846.1 hypothetical protein K9N68_02320 [Kovacikia minuta CCNUW1]
MKFVGSARETNDYLRAIAAKPSPPSSLLLLGTSGNLQASRLQPSQYQVVEKAGGYQLVRVPISVLAKSFKF